MECIRRAARKLLWLEAGADIQHFHNRGGYVCNIVTVGRTVTGSIWPFLDGHHGWNAGQFRIFPLRLYNEPSLFLPLLRRAGRNRQRLWLRNSGSGNGQVVPRQARFGHRTRACRIWRRLSHFWPSRQSGAVPALWLAYGLYDPGRNLPDDDDGGIVPIKESPCWVLAKRFVTRVLFQSCGVSL